MQCSLDLHITRRNGQYYAILCLSKLVYGTPKELGGEKACYSDASSCTACQVNNERSAVHVRIWMLLQMTLLDITAFYVPVRSKNNAHDN